MPLIDALRDLLWERDSGVCGICEMPVSRSEMEIDHIAPRARGGADVFANLRPAHGPCNRRRGVGYAVKEPRALRRDPHNQLTRLSAWRAQRNLTQEELAAKAGISRVALIRIENGQAEPHPKTTRAIARVLRLQPETSWPHSVTMMRLRVSACTPLAACESACPET